MPAAAPLCQLSPFSEPCITQGCFNPPCSSIPAPSSAPLVTFLTFLVHLPSCSCRWRVSVLPRDVSRLLCCSFSFFWNVPGFIRPCLGADSIRGWLKHSAHLISECSMLKVKPSPDRCCLQGSHCPGSRFISAWITHSVTIKDKIVSWFVFFTFWQVFEQALRCHQPEWQHIVLLESMLVSWLVVRLLSFFCSTLCPCDPRAAEGAWDRESTACPKFL